jgi:hypothetical protein
LILDSLLSSGQRVSVFDKISFDSSYTVIALSSSFHDINTDSKAFCFLVNKMEDLNEIKKDWTVKNIRPRISLEENIINIFILKDKELINSELLIYPKQGIIHMGDYWFDFDMAKFNKIQVSHPLNYHSQTFHFEAYLDYVNFKDSIEEIPTFLFMFEPTKKEFEGHFNIIAPRTSDNDSPIFVLSDITKELEKLSPSKNFRTQQVMNDKFNLENTKKVKIQVEGSKALYDAYKSKYKEKDEWIPSTLDAKVIFKD